MPGRVRVLCFALALAASGCARLGGFACERDEQCGAADARCLAPGMCAHADAACGTGLEGWRFTSGARAGQCARVLTCTGDDNGWCQDFERGDIGQVAPWTTLASGSGVDGTPSVDDAHARAGRFAMHVKLTQALSDAKTLAWISARHLDAGLSGHLFLRFWLWADSNAVATHTHFATVNMAGDITDDFLYAVVDGNAAHVEVTGGAPGGKPDFMFASSDAALASGDWRCLELELQADTSGLLQSANGAVNVWLDGRPLYGSGNREINRVTEINLGANPAPPSGVTAQPMELWLDEIRVANQRVGCY